MKKSKSILITIMCLTHIFTTLATHANNNHISNFNKLINKGQKFKNINSDSLYYYTEHALKIAQDNNELNQQVDALIILINNGLKVGNLTSSYKFSELLLDLISENELENRKAEALMNVANSFSLMGFSSEALELFIEAVNQDEKYLTYDVQTDLYYYMALLFFNTGNNEECHLHLKQCISIAKNNDLEEDLIPAYMLYANSYLDNPDTVMKYCRLSIKILESHPELAYKRIAIESLLANVNFSLDNYVESNNLFNNCISLAKEKGYNETYYNLLNNYTYLLLEMNQYDSAGFVIEETIKNINQIEDINLISSIYNTYSDFLRAIGDSKNALLYQDTSLMYKAKYREKQNKQKVELLTTAYKIEQKEKEILKQKARMANQRILILITISVVLLLIVIALYLNKRLLNKKSLLILVEKNKSLEIANALIQGQDNERKKIAMELHDHLGGSMSALRIMIDAFFKDNNKYPQIHKSVIDIHQKIRDLSHRLQPPELEELGPVQSIQNFINLVNNSNKINILFHTNIKTRLPDKIESNIYYLVYELVNNAINHSSGNQIIVQLFINGNHLLLSVDDNGGGFEFEESMPGMGLKNIRMRVEFLKGVMNIDATKTNTSFLIEIPLK